MAFFQLVIKANQLKVARRRYHDEKLRSIEISKSGKVHYTFWQRVRRRRILCKRKLRHLFHKFTSFPENTWLHKKSVLLRTEGTLENYILKSICGFIGGIILTYVFFVFFVFQLHFGLVSATIICSFLGVVLTLGLAFSPRVRCITFLFLPQFFSKRGRQALMAYAFVLALTGPVRNTLTNIAVLADSLACGQEQLKEAIKSVIDLVRQPFYALRDSLAKIVKSLKAIVRRIKKTLIAMKRLVLSILRVIKSVFDWLASIVSICNKNLGTPYDRCQRVFDNAVTDCRAKLGPVFGSVCNVTLVVGAVCYALKPLDLICVLTAFVSDAIVGEVRKKIKKFSREMKAMFYVKIKFSHSFHMETNKSRSLSDITSGITLEIKTRTDKFLSMFDLIGLLTSFFFMFLLLRVLYYRHKWLSSDRYDNHYISGYVREIDLKRARLDKETILPLNRRERNMYAAPTSILLIRPEIIKLGKSAVFLAITSGKLATYMIVDYCLFWVLDTIRYHGKTDIKFSRPVYTSSVEVEGSGFLSDIYRSVDEAFAPEIKQSEVDGIPCLPDPKPPDYDVYTRIVTTALFCWIMALFEPYGLRLRNIVLNSYYPDRAKQRAVWLYNHIIRSRGSFLKYARRQLRRKFGTSHSDSIERVTLRERIWAICPILNKLMPLKAQAMCLVCGEPERDKSAPHIRCPTPGCVGLYCAHCFTDLRKLCTVCLSPLDYGDLTDMSEERDSSEAEIDLSRLRKMQLESEAKGDELSEETAIDDKDSEITIDEKTPILPKEASDDDTSSKYSYSYQEEPTDDSTIPQKVSFRDVEAQEIRDDVTMQIFNEPLCDELLSSSEGQIFCFGLAKRKKRPVKAQRQRVGSTEESDSTSIANTESWTTEEVADSNEEELDIEIDDFDEQNDSSDELLLESCKKKVKLKKERLKKLVKGFAKLFSFKKKKKCKTVLQTCEKVEKTSSSASSICGENRELISFSESKDCDTSTLRKRITSSKNAEEEQSSCTCRGVDRVREKSVSGRVVSSGSENYYYPHAMRFKTRELPRHLQSLCYKTKYYEVDESYSSYTSPRENVRFRARDQSSITDSRSSVDSDPSRDRRSSTNDAEDSYIYTSENNNEKQHESCSQISGSSVVDDFQFSEISTDFSDSNGLLLENEATITNEINATEEDKINEDSDEKGTMRKEQERANIKNFKIHDPLAGSELFNIKDKLKSRRNLKDAKSEGGAKKLKESLEKRHSKDEKSDALKKDKVEKETANAKKRDSLTSVRMVDKSFDVKEKDFDDNSRSSIRSDRSAAGSENQLHVLQKKQNQEKVVYGFQPIVATHYLSNLYKTEDKDDSENTQEFDTGQRQTRDQSTYVRLKSKKYKAEREIGGIGTDDS